MDNHPIESLMRSTMENIRDMIDVNTIIGDPVETKEGSTLIPISKVSFGFASGGSEFDSRKDGERNLKYPFGGGSGAGVSVKPVAFIVIKNDSIRLLSVDHENTLDRIVDSVPQFIEMFKNKGNEDICKDKNQGGSFSKGDE